MELLVPRHDADAERRPAVRFARARRAPLVTLAAFAIAAATFAVTLGAPDLVRWVGAISTAAIAFTVVREHEPAAVRDRLLVAVGTGILTCSGVGLVAPDDTTTVWRLVVALLAYPLLGRAMLGLVSRYRLVRPTDVIVEAVLIGAAASIVLQVGLEMWGPQSTDPDTIGSAIPALLVGLDVALGVIVTRAVVLPGVRHLSLVFLGASSAALLASHVVATVLLAGDRSPGLPAGLLAALALLGLATACLHASFVPPPAVAAIEPPLFSQGHAGVVVLSVLAAPIVLGVQVTRDVSVSGSIATGAALSGLVLAGHIVTLLRERAESEHQATHDSLTDLPNRLLFTDRLERAIAHATRNGNPVGVLYVDLDRFKDVNDTFGHDTGDRLLEAVARRLQSCARHEDTVARLAGDEFAILLPHLGVADDVLVVADRVLDALDQPVQVGEHSLHNPGSVGAAVYPHDGCTPQDLLNAADAAMYQAKDAGGAQVGVFSADLHHAAASRLELESALVRAIERDELVLHYQPIVDAASGRTVGAEALVRWNHPERGLLQPGAFVPVAEQSGLIVRLGNWVIQEACRELSQLEVLGLGDRYLTVNVSSRHFREDLVSTVTAALRENGVEPSRLVVELTESAAVDDIEVVADRLRELRQIGVRAAIDDFGTGYCGLQYLGDLPVSTLKLDRSFVQPMTPKSAAIVAATIAMARSLGMTMVAEGVETAEQHRFLVRHGCDRMQGYFLGRPMPVEQYVDRLREEDRSNPLAEGPDDAADDAVSRPVDAAALPAR